MFPLTGLLRMSLNCSPAMNTTLSELPLGQCARVCSIEGATATDQRLLVMGLIPGVEVRKVHIAPLGDPIAVEFEGRTISLRQREAHGVLLESA